RRCGVDVGFLLHLVYTSCIIEARSAPSRFGPARSRPSGGAFCLKLLKRELTGDLTWFALPLYTDVIKYSPPAVPIAVFVLTDMTHPKLPFGGICVPQPVEAVGPLFEVDSEAAHGASGALCNGSAPQSVFAPNDLAILCGDRNVQVNGQLQQVLPVEYGEWSAADGRFPEIVAAVHHEGLLAAAAFAGHEAEVRHTVVRFGPVVAGLFFEVVAAAV